MRYNPNIHRRRYMRMMTTADVLGGTKVLGHKIKNSMDWHALILRGMPAEVISHMNRKWGFVLFFGLLLYILLCAIFFFGKSELRIYR